MLIFLQWVMPLESKQATNMETFNELANLFSLYLLMCFTDFVGQAKTRSMCGWAFILLLCAYAFVHISSLIFDSIAKLKQKIKRKIFQYRAKKSSLKRE